MSPEKDPPAADETYKRLDQFDARLESIEKVLQQITTTLEALQTELRQVLTRRAARKVRQGRRGPETAAAREKKPQPPSPDELRALRKRLGLTQAEAAEKIGVSHRAWIAWENDERTPSATATQIIRLLSENTLHRPDAPSAES